MTHLESKQSNVVRLQAEAIDHLRAQDEEQRQLNQGTDQRIADLVSALGQLITKTGHLPPN